MPGLPRAHTLAVGCQGCLGRVLFLFLRRGSCWDAPPPPPPRMHPHLWPAGSVCRLAGWLGGWLGPATDPAQAALILLSNPCCTRPRPPPPPLQIGMMVVGSPGTFTSSSTPVLVGAVPQGVDQLVPLLFTIGDENGRCPGGWCGPGGLGPGWWAEAGRAVGGTGGLGQLRGRGGAWRPAFGRQTFQARTLKPRSAVGMVGKSLFYKEEGVRLGAGTWH